MQDQNFGYGMPSPDERLHAIRQPHNVQPQPAHSSRKKWRSEVLIGVILIVLVTCVGFLLLRRPSNAPIVTNQDVAPTATVSPPSVDGLLDGEALIGVNLEVGHFPMELAEGDIVRVIVTPAMSDATEARELASTVRVTSIEAIGEFTGRFAATLLGAREVATAIATSGPVHLSIVKKGEAQ
jgi:hypothetical protein